MCNGVYYVFLQSLFHKYVLITYAYLFSCPIECVLYNFFSGVPIFSLFAPKSNNFANLGNNQVNFLHQAQNWDCKRLC